MTKKHKQQLSLCNNSLFVPYIRGQGCGNRFLIFDCLDDPSIPIEVVFTEAHDLLIKEGRDDALILKKDEEDDQRFVLTMLVLEPDKSFADFCGNGARVVAKYLQEKYGPSHKSYFLQTTRGEKKIWWDQKGYYVDMGETIFHWEDDKFINPQLVSEGAIDLGMGIRHFKFFYTETIEPHLVTWDDIEEEELQALGWYINHYQRQFFPLGINLNRVEILSSTKIKVTTFERGVNRITQACGTGATSCAMLMYTKSILQKECPIQVLMKGGTVHIQLNPHGSIVSGPAELET